MLAGWLFADLFLVLFVVALSAQPSVSLATHVKPLTDHGKQKHHSTSVTRKPTQLVLDPTPADFRIFVSPAGFDDPATKAQTASALLSELDQKLRSLHLQSRRAGFVLVFATAPQSADGQALDDANTAIALIKKKYSVTFGQAVGEGLWGGSAQGLDNFHFQIFFYA